MKVGFVVEVSQERQEGFYRWKISHNIQLALISTHHPIFQFILITPYSLHLLSTQVTFIWIPGNSKHHRTWLGEPGCWRNYRVHEDYIPHKVLSIRSESNLHKPYTTASWNLNWNKQPLTNLNLWKNTSYPIKNRDEKWLFLPNFKFTTLSTLIPTF